MDISVLSGITHKAGGVVLAVSELCKTMQQHRDVQFQAFGSSNGFRPSDYDRWEKIPVTPYKTYGPLATSFRVRKLLREADSDVVHQHGIWLDDQWAALKWQKKTGKPVVISPHGMLDQWALRNSAWKKKLVGLLFADESLQKATCIHALCQSELEAIRRYGLMNPVAVIPNGVSLPNLHNDSKSLPESGKKRLLFLGRIHPKKGIEVLLRAWDQVSQKGCDGWELLIAGWDDGHHEPGLRELTAELRIENSVSFIGAKFGDEKEELLRSVDAFILPSFSEGLPMSVLEAWSFGLPVVMTEFCNLPDGFIAGAAIKIEPDSGSIVEGLESLFKMSDADLLLIGSNGRKLVEEKYTWTSIADDMWQVYSWCKSGASRPDCIDL